MRRQIAEQSGVFVAIVFLFVGALGIGGYILSNQRFYLPAWVPALGTDFYTVQAELPTAQAVVPGQGQTVNVAGVKVGEVGEVTLENGRAVVNMQIKDEYRPIYKDATILLRPKTGLKDMILSLDPGTRGAGEIEEGGRVAVANTLPDVNADEVLSRSTATPGRTCGSCSTTVPRPWVRMARTAARVRPRICARRSSGSNPRPATAGASRSLWPSAAGT